MISHISSSNASSSLKPLHSISKKFSKIAIFITLAISSNRRRVFTCNRWHKRRARLGEWHSLHLRQGETTLGNYLKEVVTDRFNRINRSGRYSTSDLHCGNVILMAECACVAHKERQQWTLGRYKTQDMSVCCGVCLPYAKGRRASRDTQLSKGVGYSIKCAHTN